MVAHISQHPQFDILFYALGGLGEVGKNMYVVEIQGRIFIMDSGMSFSEDSFLGINYIIPSYEYLIKNEHRIECLLITHGHEDHIGSIPFLLRKVKIPKILVNGIAYDLIEFKLIEHKLQKYMHILEKYEEESELLFGQVKVSFVRLNHSIPDTFGIVFHYNKNIIFYTGDFKIDHTPEGPLANYAKLADLGKKGVLCLLSDSTNAQQKGFIESENKIGDTINNLFYQIKGRIIIVTFASNYYRIKQIIQASVLTKRKVAVFGRSMEKAIEVGAKNGYLKVPKEFLANSDNINANDENITLLCTGSQGEPLAALSRMANGTHRQIKLNHKDTVIFSSSPIPGNQDSVNKVLDLLYKMEVNVILHGFLVDTHASGHASQNDLKLMLNLIKPRFLIPVHGEYVMLMAHKKLAIECGIPSENIFILDNGDVLGLSPSKSELVGKIPHDDIYIDDSGLEDLSNSIIKERKILNEEGLLSIIVSMDWKNKRIINHPMVVSRGFIYMKGSGDFIKKISNDIKHMIQKLLSSEKVNENYLIKAIINFITPCIYETTLRNPLILPIILPI
ncbi:ribonuclease J ['Planchonia careya' phytoplasma]|nr:ribonuclease J ['Planchonia careya' phytoplasma]MDO8030160.1 ribonuclease J ['Planchonia careya' phytoplasma]